MKVLHSTTSEDEKHTDRELAYTWKSIDWNQARTQVNRLRGKNAAPWILEGDIKGCFDTISHNWLMRNISMDRSVLAQFLKAGFIFDEKLFPTNSGTPQGGIISPILANMTLDGIEKMLSDSFPFKKVYFIRYADDFLVTAPTKTMAEEARGLI